MTLALSAQRLMAVGCSWQLANAITGNGGAPGGISIQLGTGEFLYESFTDSITAASAGGQSNATLLSSEVNRITTAAAGSSVALPASVAGLTVYVINHGANAVQVFGSGTDKIDDVASATGVAQMAGSLVLYSCVTAGNWYSEGLATGYSGGLQTLSYADALSANSGGVQTNATPITTMIARFTTVGAAGYSSVLPTSAPGMEIAVINAGANAMNVFPAGTDAINSLSASAAFSQGSNSLCTFYCTVAGQWHTNYSPFTTTGTGAEVLQTNPTISGLIGGAATVAAAGATQGTAAAIPSTVLVVNVTVTASTEGVKLPTVSTGKMITLLTPTTKGYKVYTAAAGQVINAATTATTAFAMATLKAAVFVGIDTTHWRVVKSA